MLEQFDDLKQFLIGYDNNGTMKYGSVDKIMLFLTQFDNAPNWWDPAINAQYQVTYYYKLKYKMDDNDDEHIQRRVDILWQAIWRADPDKLDFEISDDGWVAQSVDCIDIPKSK